MIILTTQIALFPNRIIERPDLVYEEIKKAEHGLFNAMPNIIDIPINSPTDIPLVQAKSLDNMYSLNVSRGRIDFFINYKIDDIDPYEKYKNQREKIEIFYKTVIKLTNIFRVGVIFTLFEENNNNIKSIYEKYIKTPFSPNCSEISIRANIQQQIKDFVLNRIFIIEGTELNIRQNDIENSKKGILIQIDVNNVPKEGCILTFENINNILTNAINNIKVNKIKEMI